jgi:hypothetical protein
MSNWYINPNEKLILDDKLDFNVMPNNQLLRIKLSNHIYILYIQLLRIKILLSGTEIYISLDIEFARLILSDIL